MKVSLRSVEVSLGSVEVSLQVLGKQVVNLSDYAGLAVEVAVRARVRQEKLVQEGTARHAVLVTAADALTLVQGPTGLPSAGTDLGDSPGSPGE